MFNAGLLAISASSPYFIAGGLVTQGGAGPSAVTLMFRSDGTHAVGPQASLVERPGQWRRGGALADAGSAFEVRYVVEAGTVGVTSSGGLTGGPGTWGSLGVNSSITPFLSSNAGRIRIEIRDATTLSVVASARFWTSAYAP